MYLPYTQVHIPPIPDPEYAGKTKRGNWADLLTQMDDFTGRILDTLDELGLADDTIVVWASDNGADPDLPHAGQRIPTRSAGSGTASPGPWRGGYFTSLEGSNRTPCIIRWPGKVPAGKVSNELVHLVDMFTTLVHAAGAEVPADRQIDGMDMRDFLLGDAEESGRDDVLCIQGNRLQAIKWRQWKAHLFQQDEFYVDLVAVQHAASLQPRVGPARGAPGRLPARLGDRTRWPRRRGAFLKTLAMEPPIKPGTPDPYTPPAARRAAAREHIQIGPITQYVTSLHHHNAPDGQVHHQHGIAHSAG